MYTTVTTGSEVLRRHLVDTHLAGEVATSPRNTVTNCHKLAAGHPEYTFGLPDWHDAGPLDAIAAVRALCGGDPVAAPDPDGQGWIDPTATLRGIARHRAGLAGLAGDPGRVLLATGHPTGLLPHYATVARTLQVYGCELLAPLDDVFLEPTPDGRRQGLRFLDGVGCLFDGGSLRHTHRSRFMEAMLDELGGGSEAVDLVVADHGMAGAAIARGIPTLSIADVNDPALPLAQVNGRTDGVLVIDDNLAPRRFVQITVAMLDWSDERR